MCQWTVTDMFDPASWPEEAAPPSGAIREHIGYFHQGGLRACCPGHPMDRERWWAGPSGIGDEVSEYIQFWCGRAHATGMAGLAMYGEIGAALPAAELRYLAMEYFSWHPERSMEEFTRDRLSICYGSEDLARRYLAMLRDVTREPERISQARDEAGGVAQDSKLDVRQRLRWHNLHDELARRLRLLARPASQPTTK